MVKETLTGIWCQGSGEEAKLRSLLEMMGEIENHQYQANILPC